jgi:rsbT co-antagonist protein RsbR
MSASLDLVSTIKSNREMLTERLVGAWSACLQTGDGDSALSFLIEKTLTQMVEALETESAEEFSNSFLAWVEMQAEEGMGIDGLLCLTDHWASALWDVAEENGCAVRELRPGVELVSGVRDAAIQMLAELQHRALGQEQQRTLNLAEAQTRLAQQIRELSSPVIQVWEEVLVLPLVGTIDASRANRVMKDLLNGIVTHQAEMVIIDVTGVPEIDTNVASHLLRTIRAASLLGARSVLVGIRADMAQTMIQLGVDLGAIETKSNLQAGIQFALKVLNLEIVPSADNRNRETISQRQVKNDA